MLLMIDCDAEKRVQNAECSCPRGKFKCHHIAALMIYANKNISATSGHCQWIRVRPTEGDRPIRVEELFPPKEFQPFDEPLREEAIQRLQEKLNKSNFNVGFTWLLSKEPEPTAVAEIPTIESIIFSREFAAAVDKKSFLKAASAIEQEVIKNVAEITVGQSKNPLWFVARKYRLTASNFGKVLSACRRGRFPPSLFNNLHGAYDLSSVRSLQWGRDNEETAVQIFEKEKGVKVKKTGIWLHESGLLGASPDGMIPDENAIVEVKCPYTFRKAKNIEEAIRASKNFIIKIVEDSWVVDTDHDYYHQIQGQLHITGAEICHLVVWIPDSCLIVPFERDREWASNIEVLQKFYVNQYLSSIDLASE
ncbi:uncharacterized protein LOC111057119 isoform X2 [Nilaparvata lugens]|uniref:uncharacterized protein LOC111057119 isoform X2 n=1 Tax=Nilaparvata lugens TaxID=108931 RepID=UPI00193CAD69|nr:uncharacterized protein LOC111057119 isoform X2 [Nilaparvata lugens]